MTGRGRWLALILSLVLLAQAAVLVAWWTPILGDGRMLVIAHHGDVAHYPEGTLEAFVAAANSQADGLEIDVQPSADGTWWAFHDDGLARLTNQQGTFRDLTDEQVGGLQVVGGMGSAIAPAADYRVPRLADVLAAIEHYQGILILDVKSGVTSDYGDLVGFLGGRKAILICRTADGAAAVKALDPSIVTAASLVVQPRDNIDYRLMDARTEVRSPLDLWLGGPAMLYENGADYGKENPEWFRRAERWGAEMYLTNHIAEAIQESGGDGGGT